ncbi:hypothetical protein BDZ89DRAFT_651095 [Hymenopellis radicata]|nr:hypothetical protein BDZ89DRAFT_651095 [Hymenopellis radicata]
MFTCSSCPRTFARQRDLTRHQEIHDETTKNRFVCPYEGCTVSSRQSANLTAHIQAKHKKTTWPCEHCPLVLSSQSSRIRHRQRKHGYEKRERASASSTSKVTKNRSSSTSSSYSTVSTRSMSSSSSSEASVAGHVTSQLDKLKKISSRIEHFMEEFSDIAVKPLGLAMGTLVGEPDEGVDMGTQFQFDWASWVTTSVPELSSSLDIPNFNFDEELQRVYARLPPRHTYSPPPTPHCGLYLAPPSPASSSAYFGDLTASSTRRDATDLLSV